MSFAGYAHNAATVHIPPSMVVHTGSMVVVIQEALSRLGKQDEITTLRASIEMQRNFDPFPSHTLDGKRLVWMRTSPPIPPQIGVRRLSNLLPAECRVTL